MEPEPRDPGFLAMPFPVGVEETPHDVWCGRISEEQGLNPLVLGLNATLGIEMALKLEARISEVPNLPACSQM